MDIHGYWNVGKGGSGAEVWFNACRGDDQVRGMYVVKIYRNDGLGPYEAVCAVEPDAERMLECLRDNACRVLRSFEHSAIRQAMEWAVAKLEFIRGGGGDGHDDRCEDYGGGSEDCGEDDDDGFDDVDLEDYE